MNPYIDDPDFTLYVGDVRDVLASLPDESVHCVVTSPPYWGLRDYGTGLWDGGNPDCDHKPEWWREDRNEERAKLRGSDATNQPQLLLEASRQECGKCGARRVDRQLGLEPTPDLYVGNMVAVFREVRRVLRRDGTCWLNLGDSYAAGKATRPDGGLRERPQTMVARGHGGALIPSGYSGAISEGTQRKVPPGFKPKDLVGVPWRVAFALQADGWYLRADVIWSKPNPMPESVSDRPTKAHEYLFLLTRSPRYFYDADAIREPAEYGRREWSSVAGNMAGVGINGTRGHATVSGGDPSAGRNRRSVWEIATEPYPDAHFATFPQALVEPCVKAGTSERGCCPECGAPWEREIDRGELVGIDRGGNYKGREAEVIAAKPAGSRVGLNPGTPGLAYENKTVGWLATCGHGLEPVSCTVLDPFMGSGTTALVARRLGRRSVGVELNETYAELAARRLAQLSLLA